MHNVVEIRNLKVSFPIYGGFLQAVDGVDIDVKRGEILAIVGESGSGKSVSMLAMMGLLPATAKFSADVMRFDGNDLLGLTPKQRRRIIGKNMAMIFQEPIASLNPCFRISAQIEEVLKLHLGMSYRQRRQRTLELLAAVGIAEPERMAKSYPHQLSGGQCQRAMIAMATACHPRLLIADEPTTALDVTIQNQILKLLQDLQQKHDMSIVLITHDMGVVAEMADRAMVQYKGKTMEQGGCLEIFSQPKHPYTQALLSALPENATGRRLNTISDFFNKKSAASEIAVEGA